MIVPDPADNYDPSVNYTWEDIVTESEKINDALQENDQFMNTAKVEDYLPKSFENIKKAYIAFLTIYKIIDYVLKKTPNSKGGLDAYPEDKNNLEKIKLPLADAYKRKYMSENKSSIPLTSDSNVLLIGLFVFYFLLMIVLPLIIGTILLKIDSKIINSSFNFFMFIFIYLSVFAIVALPTAFLAQVTEPNCKGKVFPSIAVSLSFTFSFMAGIIYIFSCGNVFRLPIQNLIQKIESMKSIYMPNIDAKNQFDMIDPLDNSSEITKGRFISQGIFMSIWSMLLYIVIYFIIRISTKAKCVDFSKL